VKRFLVGLACFLGASAVRAEEDASIEVVVHEDRLGRAARRDETAASTQVDRERLDRPGADASDVLTGVPGVQVARSGSSSELATASIRGATSAQTPIYLAGIRLNDDVTGTADLSRVPLFLLDRVEVFRGSAPEQADRLGVGGAIFFEPRLPRRDTFGGGVGIGSHGERALWLGGEVASSGGGALLAVRRDSADNDYEYVDDAGTVFASADDHTVRRENADSTSWDAWAISRTKLGPHTDVTTVLNAFRRDQGVTGLGVIPAARARGRVDRLLGGITARTSCAGVDPDVCSLELTTSAILSLQKTRDPERELALFTTELTSRGRRVEQAVHAVVRPSERVRVRVGGSFENELLSIDRAEGAGLRARREVPRVDASVRYSPVEPLTLAALGAVECHGTHGPTGGDHCGTLAPSARAGVGLRALPGLAFLANVGRYVRVPTLGELFGSSALVLGNPELLPEKAVSVDAGVRASHGSTKTFGAFLDAFASARFASDLIAYRRSNFGVIRPYNVARSRVLALELNVGAEALGHVRLENATTFLDPRDTSENRRLVNDIVPFQSRLVSTTRFELHADRLVFLDRGAIGSTLEHRSSRYADPAGLVVLPEHWLLGFDAAAWTWEARLRLAASVENALDRRHIDVVGYPLPGRSYHASAELWW
jgi:iron complex outermembrane receptor protein